MPEIATKVETHIIDYICDKCNKGKLITAGRMKQGPEGKVIFLHQCSNPECKAMLEVTGIQYPFPDYKPVGETKKTERKIDVKPMSKIVQAQAGVTSGNFKGKRS